mgnify:CR=1 FL=1
MDEMKGVEDYLEIQKIRYPNAFTYLNYIFEEAENARIPSLLIINFVENVVKHALTLEEEVEIIVIACVMEKRLRISVCDTGNGMEPELLKQLQKGEIVEMKQETYWSLELSKTAGTNVWRELYFPHYKPARRRNSGIYRDSDGGAR